jgi:hypothetical protein
LEGSCSQISWRDAGDSGLSSIGRILPDQVENQDGRFDAEEMVSQHHLWHACVSAWGPSVLVSKIQGCQRAESACSLSVKMGVGEDILKYELTKDLQMSPLSSCLCPHSNYCSPILVTEHCTLTLKCLDCASQEVLLQVPDYVSSSGFKMCWQEPRARLCAIPSVARRSPVYQCLQPGG